MQPQQKLQEKRSDLWSAICFHCNSILHLPPAYLAGESITTCQAETWPGKQRKDMTSVGRRGSGDGSVWPDLKGLIGLSLLFPPCHWIDTTALSFCPLLNQRWSVDCRAQQDHVPSITSFNNWRRELYPLISQRSGKQGEGKRNRVWLLQWKGWRLL